MPRGTTKVLYIAGTGRSGSTVLANVLGEVEGCVSVGELRYLWQRGMVEDRLCGCGEPFSECPFWSTVRADTGSTSEAHARELAATLGRLLRIRALPELLRARRGSGDAALLGPLAEELARVYAAVRGRAGADVVVDSSKLPSYAALLGLVPGVEVTVVHLVRDPRAAAFSWTRRKEQPDRRQPALMERRGVTKSTALWSIWNLVLEWICRRAPERYVRVRYEEFIASPEPTVRRVLDRVGVSGTPVGRPFAVGDGDTADGAARVMLGTHHTVAGNPSRHTTGVVPLRLDDEWQQAMSRSDRMLVTGGAAGLMLRYGYPLLRRSPRGTGGMG